MFREGPGQWGRFRRFGPAGSQQSLEHGSFLSKDNGDVRGGLSRIFPEFLPESPSRTGGVAQ